MDGSVPGPASQGGDHGDAGDEGEGGHDLPPHPATEAEFWKSWNINDIQHKKNHRNAPALKIPHIMLCTVWNWMWTFWIIWEGVTGLPSAELCAALRFWRRYWLYNTRSSPLFKVGRQQQYSVSNLTIMDISFSCALPSSWTFSDLTNFSFAKVVVDLRAENKGFFAKHWRTQRDQGVSNSC